MSFVQITADFPGARAEEMSEIYKRLENGNWKKMHGHHRATDTTWMTSFVPGLSEQEAIRIAQVSFLACCSPYCRPILVLQWNNTEPAYASAEE